MMNTNNADALAEQHAAARQAPPPYAVRKALRAATLAVGRALKVKVVCHECGRKWQVSPNAVSLECANCGGVDIDVRE